MCKDEPTADNVLQFSKRDTSGDPNTLKFVIGGSDSPYPILELGPKDEIRVRGRLIERDQEVVEALRNFVLHVKGSVDAT